MSMHDVIVIYVYVGAFAELTRGQRLMDPPLEYKDFGFYSIYALCTTLKGSNFQYFIN